MKWPMILLLVICIIMVIFGAVVMFKPATFTKKENAENEEEVKKTKKWGLITMGVAVLVLVVAFIFMMK